jgi:hypothetical protein
MAKLKNFIHSKHEIRNKCEFQNEYNRWSQEIGELVKKPIGKPESGK